MGTFNNATKVYGTAVGATHFKISENLIPTSCSWCRLHVGRTYRLGMFMPHLPKHPHCFLPETLVRTETGMKPISQIQLGEKVLTHRGRYRSVTFIHRNYYNGKIKKMMDVSSTLNHPFLTKQGWIRADSIDDVNEIVCGNVGYDFKPITNLKTNKSPFSTAKQNLLSSIILSFLRRVVPVSPINFDGNLSVGKSKVNVVDVKGKLRNNRYILRLKGVKKFLFQFRKFGVVLVKNCSLAFFSVTVFTVTRCSMGCLISCVSLTRRFSRPHNLIGFASRTQFDSRLSKSYRNHSLRDSKLFSYFPLIHSRIVHAYNLVHRYLFPNIQLITTNCNIDGKYKGFVYNLEVKEDRSYCVGEKQLIAHNCIHYFIPLRIGAPPDMWSWLFS